MTRSYIIHYFYGLNYHSSAQNTIKSLRETQQTVKLNIYKKLRGALLCIFSAAALISLYEAKALSPEHLAEHWDTKYIYTDVLTHMCFFLIVLVG